MYKLGIDIGASHIGMGIYDSNKKELIKKTYIKYKRPNKIFNRIFNSYITNKYINFLIKNIDLFIDDYSINYIGIGCPGGVDIEKSIFYGSTQLVVGKVDFKKALSKYNCKIYIDNDCNCAAIGEALNNNYNEFLMITIGTGVGFSLVKKENNNILLGKDQIIWDILSINKIPNQKHKKYISSFKSLSKEYNKKNMIKMSRNAIFNDIENNRELLNKYINNFSIGINLINNKIELKNICIGGGFSEYQKYYLQDIKKSLPNYNIFVAKNNNDAGIIGAAQLPIDRY